MSILLKLEQILTKADLEEEDIRFSEAELKEAKQRKSLWRRIRYFFGSMPS